MTKQCPTTLLHGRRPRRTCAVPHQQTERVSIRHTRICSRRDAQRKRSQHSSFPRHRGCPRIQQNTLCCPPLPVLVSARASTARAILVGLGGWHPIRMQLDAMDGPWHAHSRRGSHWTFDPLAYLGFVARLRRPIRLADSETNTIYAPSFDHVVKAPLDAHPLDRRRRGIVCHVRH